MTRPELLMPVGNTESFFAAAEGGADAVYLGLRRFNARNRADNFTKSQLIALLNTAKEKNIKVYLTLNTVIKNQELHELLDVLHFLNQVSIDALIIQDWGVYYLVKKYFPNLKLHASTQMGFHNSSGTSFAGNKGFERVILARELTMLELISVNSFKHVDLEIFIHGALCYSFSGMCLFSSYIGGMGANRGVCTQPCRRIFKVNNEKKYLFSLKDNELLNLLPRLAELCIKAFKVEGRMKSAEYVYFVAKAYRLVMDDPGKIQEAEKLLRHDMGRQKTSYFAGSNVKEALSGHPDTGMFIGNITKKTSNSLEIKTKYKLKTGNRLRVHNAKTDKRKIIKVKGINYKNTGSTVIKGSFPDVTVDDKVFMTGFREKKFQNKPGSFNSSTTTELSDNRKGKMLKITGNQYKPPKKEQIFIRIDKLKWIRKIRFPEIDGLIINLTKKEWKKLDTSAPFMKRNAGKIWIEFPGFISESNLSFYEKLSQNMINHNFNQFMLNHVSQKVIIPKNSKYSVSENVYTYNDQAINFLKDLKVENYIYPFENDIDNLMNYRQIDGIVPVYFYPRLFYSRMPVDLKAGIEFTDDRDEYFNSYIRDGITITVPSKPVSLLQYKQKLTAGNFRKFLIDLSFEKPSGNILKKLIKRLINSQQVQPSTNFNFVNGLK